MRQLTLKLPAGKGEEVLKIAGNLEGKNLFSIKQGTNDVVVVNLPNQNIEDFLQEINSIKEAEINFYPQGIITLGPPASEAQQQVKDVQVKSPIEIFLSGIQSVGSMKGFVGYAFAAGVVVWIGLYAQTMYLLTASMLIAPFAGPAMNAALASSSGEASLLQKSIKRYFIALVVTVATAALLTLVMGQKFATSLMVSVSQISEVSILLPLIAGFAGALNLTQSDRDSLVSGAAVGVLVAASLAPPAGVLGMAIAMKNWTLAQSGLFLLFLQLAGINLSAALVFRYFGKVDVNGVRFQKGKSSVYWSSLTVSVLLLAGLLYWQFYKPPQLQKSSIDSRVEKIMKNVLQTYKEVKTIEATARFTRGNAQGIEPIYCRMLLTRTGATDSISDQALKTKLVSQISDSIKAKAYNIQPVYEITFLIEGPK